MKQLILHIGTGKTGISSIRNQLIKNKQLLEKNNIYYLGKFFEHSSSKEEVDWARPNGFYMLEDKSSHTIRLELSNILQSISQYLPKEATCIIANESLHHGPVPFAQAFVNATCDINCSLHALAYARSHPSYLQSAYKQWGVRHKTKEGPIVGFKQWCLSEERFSIYAEQINQWNIILQDKLDIYNYDSIENTHEHFFEIIKKVSGSTFDLKMDKEKFYATPSDESIFIYALNNNRHFSRQLPQIVETYLNAHYRASNNPPLDLEDIVPSDETLVYITNTPKIKNDIDLINRLLLQKGQNTHELIVNSAKEQTMIGTRDSIVSSMLSSLIAISISQHAEIEKLKDELRALKSSVEEIGKSQKSKSEQINSFQFGGE